MFFDIRPEVANMWFPRIHDPEVPSSNPAAARAVLESKKALRRVQARSQEVAEVVEASKKFKKENHFAEDLQNIFGGRAT